MTGVEGLALGGLSRGDYVDAVARLLWPGGPDGDQRRTLLALPDRDSARVVLPVERRAAAEVLRARAATSVGGRGRQLRIASAVASAGLLPIVRGHRIEVSAGGSFEDHLGQLLGQDVRVGWVVGPARANRKPVLHAVRLDGSTLAFVKLAVDPLTTRLVDAECAALGRLTEAGLRTVRSPRLLAPTTWHDLTGAVLEPLDTQGRRAAVPQQLSQEGMREVSAIGARDAAITASRWWADVCDRLDGVSDAQVSAATLAAVRRLADLDPVVRLGAWHGDWNPGNMARSGDRLLVWDWERFAEDVPAGMDLVHHDLHEAVNRRGQSPADASAHILDDCGQRLASSEVTAASAPVVVLAHLVELAVRFGNEHDETPGSRVRQIDSWLPEALSRATSRVTAGAAIHDTGDRS